VSMSQGPELHLDLSKLVIGLCCSRRCLHQRGMSCILKFQYYMRRNVLLLCVSTPKWAKLHLYLSTVHYICLCCSRRCLRPVLHLDVSTPRGLSCTGTSLDNRSLCCSWKCLKYRGVSCIWTYLDYSSLCCSWTCLHYRDLCYTRTCLHTGV
jgi:hypothetical protein